MTHTALRFSVLAPLVALLFAMPAFASSNTYDSHGNNNYGHGSNYKKDRDYDRDRIPSCTLKANPNTTGYGGQVRLTWDSTYADYGVLTDVGTVNPDGERVINVYTSKTYYLTVYNDGRSSTCSALVNIPGDKHYGGYYPNYYTNYPTYQYPSYTYPTTPTYVALSQIPYTGFDFGPVGNAFYWAALALLAIAGAYMLLYGTGNAQARTLAREVSMAARNQMRFIRSLVR